MNYHFQAFKTGSNATTAEDFNKLLLYGYTYDKINRMIGADAERRSVGDGCIRYNRTRTQVIYGRNL